MLFFLGSAGAGDAPAARLELSAEPPVIPVPATVPGRRFIELPALEYRFDVHAACSGGRAPRSLSISIADSRVALSGDALEKQPAGELVLTVPARQLAPIAVDDFCLALPGGDGGPAPATAAAQPRRAPPAGVPAGRQLLTVPAVVSAQASLVCGDESGTDIRYVTQPLAVTLACTAPAPAGAVVESVRNEGDR